MKDGTVTGRRGDYLGLVGRIAARWPQRSEGFRFRARLEVGYAPEVPTRAGAGLGSSVGHFAWNVTASLMDFQPGHSIGFNYADPRAGWLLSPNFPENERSFELRWMWRPAHFPPGGCQASLAQEHRTGDGEQPQT